jgi:hypothetical protein
MRAVTPAFQQAAGCAARNSGRAGAGRPQHCEEQTVQLWPGDSGKKREKTRIEKVPSLHHSRNASTWAAGAGANAPTPRRARAPGPGSSEEAHSVAQCPLVLVVVVGTETPSVFCNSDSCFPGNACNQRRLQSTPSAINAVCNQRRLIHCMRGADHLSIISPLHHLSIISPWNTRFSTFLHCLPKNQVLPQI